MRCTRGYKRGLCVQTLDFSDEVTTSLSKHDFIIDASLLDRLNYSREPMVYVVT